MLRFLLLGFLSLVAAGPPSRLPKHIVLIVADDQGLTDIGYNDPDFAQATPTLDDLAKEGITLTHMYAQATCSPTRASLLTGKYVNKIDMQDGPLIPGEERHLPLSVDGERVTLLPELLQENEFRTVGIGKWHLGHSDSELLPTSRGFDEWYGNLGGAVDYYSYDVGTGCNGARPPVIPPTPPIPPPYYPSVPPPSDEFHATYGTHCLINNGYDANDMTSGGSIEADISIQGSGEHYTSILARKATEKVLEHNEEENLFLYLAPTAPHSPLQVDTDPAKGHSSRCSAISQTPNPPYPFNTRNAICQLMAGVDDMVRDVMEALDEKGMLDDTVFVYTSDNGGVREYGSTNGGLNGQKGSMLEGGVRVPSFIGGRPVKKAKRTSYAGITHVTDLFSTIAFLAGVEQPADVDGQSLLTELHGNKKLGFNSDFHRESVFLGKGGQTMGAGFSLSACAGLYQQAFPTPQAYAAFENLLTVQMPFLTRPTAGVVFHHHGHVWKYTDFPNALAFYVNYEPSLSLASVGPHLFDLTNDPLEQYNLARSTDTLHTAALVLGRSMVDGGGTDSPLDLTPGGIEISSGPNGLTGCWLDDSSVDCQYGLNSNYRVIPFVNPQTMTPFLPPMCARVFPVLAPSLFPPPSP